MMTPQERYGRDNDFRVLVDLLTDQIIRCQYSPTELREAAVLAAIHYETRYARPSYLIEGDSLRRVDSYHGREGVVPPLTDEQREEMQRLIRSSGPDRIGDR